jgi:hypothetical protein
MPVTGALSAASRCVERGGARLHLKITDLAGLLLDGRPEYPFAPHR